jgi:signal transduction histidine kinase
MRSLRARLFWVWALSLLASLAVGVLLVRLQGRSTSAEVAREADDLAAACGMIGDAYSYYVAGWAGPVPAENDPAYRADLTAVVSVALAPLGVHGGIWHAGEGALAGDAADGAVLGPLATEVAGQDEPGLRQVRREGGIVLIEACPLRGPNSGSQGGSLVGWTTSRVVSQTGGQDLWLGLGVLLVLMLAISGWLTWLVQAWSRHVREIERALATHEAGAGTGMLPRLPPTGERELDRIIAALNIAADRLAGAQSHAAALSARVAAAERMAALGRVAAGVAHEIRNPIAAMRLKAENALAGDDTRRKSALAAILGQVARLDRLLSELLAMTQRREAAPERVHLGDFLTITATEQPEGLERIMVTAPAALVRIDPALTRRVIDNLLRNAVQHSPQGGIVHLSAEVIADTLRIEVRDEGPGVAPSLRDTLFEPFVTGRADGTGLGLAIARESAQAHGGRLSLIPTETGASFRLEIPLPPCP